MSHPLTCGNCGRPLPDVSYYPFCSADCLLKGQKPTCGYNKYKGARPRWMEEPSPQVSKPGGTVS